MALPVWEPSAERVERANLSRFIKFARNETGNVDLIDHHSLHHWSIADPERFWLLVWDFCGIRGQGERTPVLVQGKRIEDARWFPNVRLNFAQNLLRYSDDKPALVFRNEVGDARELSYAELGTQVAQFAAALRDVGVGIGDRVAGLLPNIPEAAIAMLATASLGATWSSVSPDLSVDGVVARFGQIEPKVLVCAASYAFGGLRFGCIEKAAGVAARVDSISRVVVVPYLDAGSPINSIRSGVAWNDFVAPHAGARLAFTAVPFDQPLYILFAPNAAGAPIGIVHGVGGTLIQHLKELVLHTDVRREDHIFYYTTCGFLMWNWLLSSLAAGATLVLYDGSPTHPHAGALFDLADECEISVFGTSAKWLAAACQAGVKPIDSHKLLNLRTILSAGSPLDSDTYDYVYRDIKQRLMLASIGVSIDTASCYALGSPLLPVYRGEVQCRGLGLAVEVLDDQGNSVRDAVGNLACTAPFPSMPVRWWGDEVGTRYRAAYFEIAPGNWCHGERASITANDGIVLAGRA